MKAIMLIRSVSDISSETAERFSATNLSSQCFSFKKEKKT